MMNEANILGEELIFPDNLVIGLKDEIFEFLSIIDMAVYEEPKHLAMEFEEIVAMLTYAFTHEHSVETELMGAVGFIIGESHSRLSHAQNPNLFVNAVYRLGYAIWYKLLELKVYHLTYFPYVFSRVDVAAGLVVFKFSPEFIGDPYISDAGKQSKLF